jgi:uncharacterized protein YbcV (DUF1398 family)
VFTIEQIEEVHERLGTADTLADYVRSLAALGVVRYDSFVLDGHTEYHGSDATRLISNAAHDKLAIADTSDPESLAQHLRQHVQGDTTYMEMSKGLADSGIKQWSVDTQAMTMTFYDQSGAALLVEGIS